MSINAMPEVLSAYRVYLEGTDLLGTADVTLPDIEFLSETIKGAGIAGEIEVPIMGHTGPLGLTINFRAETPESVKLAAPKSHQIEFRGVIQVYDEGSGTTREVTRKVVVKARPKKKGLGKLETAAAMDIANEFECSYIKMFMDGKEVLEIDKYNYIYKVDGVDYLAATRKGLGL